MLIYLYLILLIAKHVFTNEPQIIPFSIPNDLVKGSKVKLMCSVSKGSHPLKFEWLFNNYNLFENDDLFLQHLDDASILNIKNLQLNHNGNYTCVVNNRFGRDAFTSILTINAPPQWIKKPQEKVDFRENESSYLDCIANGHPSPKTFWYKEYLVINSKNNEKTTSNQNLKVLNNGTLHFDSIQKQDEGNYVCTVDNSVGEKLIAKTTILVQLPVKIYMIDDKGQEVTNTTKDEVIFKKAKKGESYSIRCNSIGDSPITIDWSRDGKQMQYKFSSHMETLTSSTTSGLISELHFKSLQRTDSAYYECKAKNSLGQSSKSIKLIVIEPPDPPTDIKISELDSNSVKINWMLGFNGNSDLTKIHIYYWQNGIKKTNINSKLNKVEIELASSTWHVLKSLESGISYSLAIACVNSVGESALSNTVKFETKIKNPAYAPTDLIVKKVFGTKVSISWRYSEKERQDSNVTGFQVFYKPRYEQNYFIERIILKERDLTNKEIYGITLVNLKKNTKYLIKVKSYNKEGYSPDSEEIECQTLKGKVPDAPKITYHQIHSRSYLTLKWEHTKSKFNDKINAALKNTKNQAETKVKNDDQYHIEDYEKQVQYFMAYLEIKELNMIVQTIPVPPSQRQVTIANLEKDIEYNIYVTAFNGYGESPLSEPLIIKIQSYQYEMNIFIAERNALIVTAISIGVIAILVSIICSVIYMKRIQIAQQEKLRKLSTLTLSKCGTTKSSATYATYGNSSTNAPSTSTGFTNYNIQLGQLNQTYNQPGTYHEIDLNYGPPKTVNNSPHLTTFGNVTIRSADSNTNSSDTNTIQTMQQLKDRLHQSDKSLNSMKNMRNYDECIYDDALG